MARTPVIFVHGWAGSASSWRPVESALDARVWDIVVVRLPGSPGGGPGAATVANATDEVVDALEKVERPAILVGHSMGAQATLLAHGRVPDLVHSEVVIDPAYGGAASSRDSMSRWATSIEHSGTAAVEGFFTTAMETLHLDIAAPLLDDMRNTAPSVLASYLRSEYVDADSVGLFPATSDAALDRRRPVLSVHSTHEGHTRESSIPSPEGSRSDYWPGHGHYLHLEDAPRFVTLLDSWRRSIDDQRKAAIPVSASDAPVSAR